MHQPHPKKYIATAIFIILITGKISAQEHPPRPIKVTTFQNIAFGAFFQATAGGSVIIYPDGLRSSTGDVVLANLGFIFHQAIFEVQAQPGVIINITKGPDVWLSGSNGGSLQFKIGDLDPSSPYVNTTSPPGKSQVNVGGTLIVGSPPANPEGSYSGSFLIIFNQE